LVTGGTGSFGRAFAAHALAVGARRVTVFSRDELKQSEMASQVYDERLRFMLGTVTDRERVTRALRGVDYVVHAAAMKQVPACELHPWEAMQTNVVGAQVVAGAAIEAGVERVVFLSTDKAAAPNTLYGATKLAAERIWTQANVYAAGTRTRLCATRYGNVVGSRGSVVPAFREQAKSGMLTITDRRMTRFWMRLCDSVALVETALAEARGGEVFVPKVGACDILTVAEAVAPGVPWTETGIRRGEKLHETLISEDEARDTYDCGDHYRIEPERSWEYLPPLCAPLVPRGWSYRSDTNPYQLTVEGMRELL
jgi:UDP-N-acetylglucosamine 4,6-dehydratase